MRMLRNDRRRSKVLGLTLVASMLWVSACGDDDESAGDTTPVASSAEPAAETTGAPETPETTAAPDVPETSAAADTTDAPDTTPAASDECADEFDQTLIDAAKEEGQVVFYTAAHTDDQAKLLADGYEERFGIDTEYIRNSSGDVINQIQAELSAGDLKADFVGVGSGAGLQTWKDEGLLAPVTLPNAGDFTAGLWTEGNPVLPGHVAAYGVLYNTERTPNPPTSWAELAAAGGIGVPDPNASSGMIAFLYALDQIMGEEYLPQLVGGVALVTESGTALPQLVMTGEVDFSTPTVPQFLAGLLEQGEPAGLMFMSEGTPVVPTGLATFVDAPHPNAGQLLAQYAVSCEFQKHMVETGSISVLSYLPIPQPEGANELKAADLVPINDIDALAVRDSLLQRFNDAKG